MRAASAPHWRLSPTSFDSFEALLNVRMDRYIQRSRVSTWFSFDHLCNSASRLRNYHYHYSHMVQGKTKGLKIKASTGRKAQHAAAITKKGQRTIAPKKSILIKQATLHKVHRASSSSPTSLSNQLHPNRI